jgi:hypothetical protein
MRVPQEGSQLWILRFLMMVYLIIPGNAARGEEIKHQITGLFSMEREQDLRLAFEKIADVKLVGIDFKNAEVILDYVPTKIVPGAKPGQVLQKVDSLIKTASNNTFGVKPLQTIPQEKLKLVVIPVAGLDCKACCLAAYEAIYRLEGVERATASFREGQVTAWIDPEKVDRAMLEAALQKKGVDTKSP